MLSIFWSSLSGVLIILIMIAAGFVMNERHWFTPGSPKVISKIVTQVALPTYMISTITTKFTAAELKTLLPDLRYPVLSMLILFALSFAVARALAIKKSHIGLFSSMFFNSNTVFLLGCRSTWLCLARVRFHTCWSITWPIRLSFGRWVFG